MSKSFSSLLHAKEILVHATLGPGTGNHVNTLMLLSDLRERGFNGVFTWVYTQLETDLLQDLINISLNKDNPTTVSGSTMGTIEFVPLAEYQRQIANGIRKAIELGVSGAYETTTDPVKTLLVKHFLVIPPPHFGHPRVYCQGHGITPLDTAQLIGPLPPLPNLKNLKVSDGYTALVSTVRNRQILHVTGYGVKYHGRISPVHSIINILLASYAQLKNQGKPIVITIMHQLNPELVADIQSFISGKKINFGSGSAEVYAAIKRLGIAKRFKIATLNQAATQLGNMQAEEVLLLTTDTRLPTAAFDYLFTHPNNVMAFQEGANSFKALTVSGLAYARCTEAMHRHWYHDDWSSLTDQNGRPIFGQIPPELKKLLDIGIRFCDDSFQPWQDDPKFLDKLARYVAACQDPDSHLNQFFRRISAFATNIPEKYDAVFQVLKTAESLEPRVFSPSTITSFYNAVTQGHITQVSQFLEEGLDPKHENAKAVALAIAEKQWDVFDVLVKDHEQWPEMHCHPELRAFSQTWDRSLVDVLGNSSTCTTSSDMIRGLKSLRASLSNPVMTTNKLCALVIFGETADLKTALRNHIPPHDINDCCSASGFFDPPLVLAAKMDRLLAIGPLLRAGATVTANTLEKIAGSCDFKTFRKLFHHKKLIDRSQINFSAIIANAIKTENVELIDGILDAAQEFELTPENVIKLTHLNKAVNHNLTKLSLRLLELLRNSLLPDQHCTALHDALAHNNMKLALAFLDLGMSFNHHATERPVPAWFMSAINDGGSMLLQLKDYIRHRDGCLQAPEGNIAGINVTPLLSEQLSELICKPGETPHYNPTPYVTIESKTETEAGFSADLTTPAIAGFAQGMLTELTDQTLACFNCDSPQQIRLAHHAIHLAVYSVFSGDPCSTTLATAITIATERLLIKAGFPTTAASIIGQATGITVITALRIYNPTLCATDMVTLLNYALTDPFGLAFDASEQVGRMGHTLAQFANWQTVKTAATACTGFAPTWCVGFFGNMAGRLGIKAMRHACNTAIDYSSPSQ